MNEEKAVGNLREIKEIFDKIGIDYWLDTGTLLGAVRDGRIIEWDTDVDLGTWYGNAKQIASMFAEFEKKGFEICLNERKGNVTTRRSGCDVSFYLYRKRGDYAWTLWYAKGKGIEKMLIWCLYTLSPSICSKQKEKSIRKSELFLSLLPSKLISLGLAMSFPFPKRAFEATVSTGPPIPFPFLGSSSRIFR